MKNESIRKRLDAYVREVYGIEPEILPFSHAEYEIYRHMESGKWFAVFITNAPCLPPNAPCFQKCIRLSAKCTLLFWKCTLKTERCTRLFFSGAFFYQNMSTKPGKTGPPYGGSVLLRSEGIRIMSARAGGVCIHQRTRW